VLVAIAAVSAGIVGNVLLNPQYIVVFLEYFVPTVLIVVIMLERIAILRFILFLVRSLSAAVAGTMKRLSQRIREKIDEINSQEVVFFTRGDNLANLNMVLRYVQENEHTNRLKIVIVVQDESEIPPRLADDLDFLDEAYPDIKIDFVVVHGKFGPELIKKLSREWNIPTNFMFIGSPGSHFPYRLSDLGGVRLII